MALSVLLVLLFGRGALANGVIMPARRFVTSVLRPLPSAFIAIFTPTPAVQDARPVNGEDSEAVADEVAETPTATPSPMDTPTPMPTAVPTFTPTPVPDTPTPTPTEMSEPTSTPTLPVGTVGQPTPTTAAPTSVLTPVTGQVYKVRSGDTLESIAWRFGVTVDAIVAANNLADPNRLDVDQELIIPSPSAQTTPTPPTVAPTATALAYSAPVLLGPANGSTVEGGADTATELRWAAVGTLSGNEFYMVTFSYRRESGGTWTQWFLSRTEAMRMPRDLYGLAQGPDRLYQWYVQVVRLDTGNKPVPLSPPSEVWSLRWP